MSERPWSMLAKKQQRHLLVAFTKLPNFVQHKEVLCIVVFTISPIILGSMFFAKFRTKVIYSSYL